MGQLNRFSVMAIGHFNCISKLLSLFSGKSFFNHKLETFLLKHIYRFLTFLWSCYLFVWSIFHHMGIYYHNGYFSLSRTNDRRCTQGFISKLAPENMRTQYFAAASLRYTFGRTVAPMSIPFTIWIGYNGTFFI